MDKLFEEKLMTVGANIAVPKVGVGLENHDRVAIETAWANEELPGDILNTPINDSAAHCLVWLVKHFGIAPFLFCILFVAKCKNLPLRFRIFRLKFAHIRLQFSIFLLKRENKRFKLQNSIRVKRGIK